MSQEDLFATGTPKMCSRVICTVAEAREIMARLNEAGVFFYWRGRRAFLDQLEDDETIQLYAHCPP